MTFTHYLTEVTIVYLVFVLRLTFDIIMFFKPRQKLQMNHKSTGDRDSISWRLLSVNSVNFINFANAKNIV